VEFKKIFFFSLVQPSNIHGFPQNNVMASISHGILKTFQEEGNNDE